MRSYLHVIFLAIVIAVVQGCSSNEERSPELLLKLRIDNNRLHKEENSTLKVIATFSDNSTKEVTNQVTWSIAPTDALTIQNQHLQAVQDGNITLQAKLGNTQSNSLHVNVFWEINGYRLPPEPDPKVNNATLLGIDVNNNGVRDDVERYLLNKYKDHHKIVSEIALQSGRAFQIILEDPDHAKETTKFMDAAQFCNYYFKSSAKSYGDPILVNHNIMDYKFEDLQLNTKERIKAYLDYNHNLSGGVYRMAGGLERKASCDFNVTELLKSQL